MFLRLFYNLQLVKVICFAHAESQRDLLKHNKDEGNRSPDSFRVSMEMLSGTEDEIQTGVRCAER